MNAARTPHELLDGHEAETANGSARKLPRRIDAFLASGLARAERRCSKAERPIPLPWPSLAEHFGGGLRPGLHILNKATGVGGTQFALQAAMHAAKAHVPVVYFGLELGDLDFALRLLGEEASVPWSSLWTGDAGPSYLRRVREAAHRLEAMKLPFHIEPAPPMGLPPSSLLATVETLRASHPEDDGPGSRPMLVVVDFLQLVGDEPGTEREVRSRIGGASYALRDLANRLGCAVLCISSVAREKYKLTNAVQSVAGLAFELDEQAYPVERRILDPDAIVGAGKESGDIEYSADSVSLLARVPETWDGRGCDVVFATAKGRATGARWSPLHFTGFRYEECEDRGGRMVDTWKQAADKAAQAREEKRSAKEDAKTRARREDAEAIRSYVLANPGCTVRNARVHAVNDQPARWAAGVAELGAELVQTKRGKAIALSIALAMGEAAASAAPARPAKYADRGDRGEPWSNHADHADHGRAPGPTTVVVVGGGVRGGVTTTTVDEAQPFETGEPDRDGDGDEVEPERSEAPASDGGWDAAPFGDLLPDEAGPVRGADDSAGVQP